MGEFLHCCWFTRFRNCEKCMWLEGRKVRYKEIFGSSLKITQRPIVVESLPPREQIFSQVHHPLNPPHPLTFNMLRTVALTLPIAFLLLAGVRAEDAKSPAVADEATRGGGYSQQYHYNSYPSHGGGGGHDPYGYTYAGLSFDLSTGLFLALGAIIVLLALAAVIYPLLSKNSGYGDSYSSGGGWTGGAGGSSSYGSYRSYNIAGTAEKVLSAIEKVYDAYNKSQ